MGLVLGGEYRTHCDVFLPFFSKVFNKIGRPTQPYLSHDVMNLANDRITLTNCFWNFPFLQYNKGFTEASPILHCCWNSVQHVPQYFATQKIIATAPFPRTTISSLTLTTTTPVLSNTTTFKHSPQWFTCDETRFATPSSSTSAGITTSKITLPSTRFTSLLKALSSNVTTLTSTALTSN